MALREIGFEVTTRCNFRCAHCLRDMSRPTADLDTQLLRDILAQCRALGLERVILTGGEPTLHPTFTDLCRTVADAGLSFTIVTNGSRHNSIVKLLSAVPREALASVSLSFDGATVEAHDAIRGGGAFEANLRTLGLCVVSGVEVGVHIVMMRGNESQIEPLAELVASLGASRVSYGHMQARRPDDPLVLSVEEKLACEARVLAIARTCPIPVSLGADRYCEAPLASCPALALETLSVDVHGRLVFCCMLSGVPGASADQSEVIADLTTTSLVDAVGLLALEIGRYQGEKAQAASSLTPADHFPCVWCGERFGGRHSASIGS